MRIKRSVAVVATTVATIAATVILAAPAYAIGPVACDSMGGTVKGVECLFHITDADTQKEGEQAKLYKEQTGASY